MRNRKLNLSLVFISQSSLKVPKFIRLNAAHQFIMNIPKKTEIQQITSNHSSDIESEDFMKFSKDYIKKSYSFLLNINNFAIR